MACVKFEGACVLGATFHPHYSKGGVTVWEYLRLLLFRVPVGISSLFRTRGWRIAEKTVVESLSHLK